MVRSLLDEMKATLSRSIIDTLGHFLLEGKADRCFKGDGLVVYIDRKHAFFCREPLPELPERIDLNYGEITFGAWKAHLGPSAAAPCTSTGWKEAWQGRCEVLLPAGKYTLAAGKSNMLFQNKCPLGKWWSDHKVPAFLRERIPVVQNGERVVHEFLTGRSFCGLEACENYVLLRIEREK